MISLLVAVVALTGAAVHGQVADSRIVGGDEASYGDHPYICSLQVRQGWSHSHICGCVIYNRNTVVTAAHCLDGSSASSLRIQAGLHRLSITDTYQVSRTIASYTMHPQYSANAPGFPNDIAVMQLSSPLDFNAYVTNVTIDDDANNSWEGQQCTLSGWGRLSGSGSPADILKKVSMTKISNSDCNTMWTSVNGPSIRSSQICFFDYGKSACSGDSGGPVRCGNTLTGVTSWGVSTCSGNFPSVYTRLSYYADWMRTNAWY